MATDNEGTLAKKSTADLLRMHSRIHAELRKREVVRTANNPVGDYAEWLAKGALRLDLANNSSNGYDAIDTRTRKRYQIKSIRRNHLGKAPQFGALRKLDEKRFDFLVAVLLAEDYAVERAAIVPYKSVVGAVAGFSEHTKANVLLNNSRLWEAPGVKDVTKKFQAQQAKALAEVA